MPATHRNRLVTAISNTPGTSGALTIAAAASGYRTFVAGDDGLSFDVSIVDGTSWEIRTGCVYTHSGTSLSRGTREDSSTGADISLTSSAVVTVTMSAGMGNVLTANIRGYIAGLKLTYSSTTAVAVSSGKIDINGVLRDYTGATYTSASTMKNMANATVTLGASKAYTVFAYNNAGTVEIRFEDRDGTGDGAACTWDAGLDYYKAATTGVEARKIGVVYTNASSNLLYFKYSGLGRDRQMMTAQGAALVMNGAATSFTSLTMTPWIYSDDQSFLLGVSGRRVGTAGGLQPLVSIDGGASNSINIRGYIDIVASSITFGNQFVANTGTLHYMLNGGNADCTLSLNGLGVFI